MSCLNQCGFTFLISGSQRAFRERQKTHSEELEARIQQLQSFADGLQAEKQSLEETIERLRQQSAACTKLSTSNALSNGAEYGFTEQGFQLNHQDWPQDVYWNSKLY